MIIENYGNFGKVVKLEKDGVVARITVDLGPRIIYFGTETFNFLYEDEKREVRNDKFGWLLYGGHRIWKSPELDDTYVADNFPVEYEEADDRVRFVQGPNANGLVSVLDVGFTEEGFLVKNTQKNTAEKPVRAALWALTVMSRGGTLYLPANTKDTGLLPNRNLVFWPYNCLSDTRFSVGEKLISLRQREDVCRAFKAGFFLDGKRAYYATQKGLMAFAFSEGESTSETDLGYPDFCCNFETYTSEKILEIEGLSSTKILGKGQSVSMSETWKIYEDFRPESGSENTVFAELQRLGLEE